MTITIFSTYFYQAPIFSSKTVIPIQGGAAGASFRLPMLSDDTGDNISAKNSCYGELSVMYWVWKNYLDLHPDISHIGFFQYRRILDLAGKRPGGDFLEPRKSVFQRVGPETYAQHWAENQAADISYLTAYDLVMPPRHQAPEPGLTLRRHYDLWHPIHEMEAAARLLRARRPHMAESFERAMNSEIYYFTLVFIMRREIFLGFMNWLFPILFELEKISDWPAYNTYHSQRIAAYLAERLLNVWITHQQATGDFRLLERPGYLLHGVKPDEPLPVKAPTDA